MRIVGLILVGAFAASGACGGAIEGAPVAPPAKLAAAAPARTATTAEPGGLRVLAHGAARRGAGGLLATTPDQLADLWSGVGLTGDAPAVDFTSHVVLGTSFEGGDCPGEIVAAQVDAQGTLVFDETSTTDWCDLLAVRVAQVVAVPRAMLPARFTWRVGAREAYAFELTPSREGARSTAPAPSPSLERPAIAAPRGTVALPPAGHLALRTLDDGREVWVAHRASGDVSVVLADGDTGRAGFRARIGWDKVRGRFRGMYDSHGRSVHGRAALDALAFARVGADRVAIGEPAPVLPGPIEPRADAPVLDGAAEPYDGAAPVMFDAIADGHLGVVAADLVSGLDGPPRLCTLPTGKLRGYLPGCPVDAPALAVAPSRERTGLDLQEGPLIVRRRGGGVDLVIELGHGMAGWVVEHRLAPPAARGDTRARGVLVVGATAAGDTHGARDGFTPPCIPPEARGGPDERWTFTAPRTATYAIQLDSDHDGVLAALDSGGEVLACNDDRHGFYRSSVVHVALRAGDHIAVVVDAFGGDAQRYSLRVQQDHALAGDGVLALATPVTGDTTGATDDHSQSCYAPAGDDAYRLTIARAGRYTFRIDTPGWAPLISILDASGSAGCYTTRPPLVTTQQLAAGTYTVVVDGADERAHGRYTLRVDPATAP